MKVGQLIINTGSKIFIGLLVLLPVAAVISVGNNSNPNLFFFLAETLAVLPAIGFSIAGAPQNLAMKLGAGFAGVCGACFVIRQAQRIIAWRRR